MRVRIEGYDLPGRMFCGPSGEPYNDVRVGVQIRKDPEELVPANAQAARWELDLTVVEGPDDGIDFKGPAVHGKRGDRFLYLTWGNVDTNGEFEMFRRAKLMLNRIDPNLIHAASDGRTASLPESGSATTTAPHAAPESTHQTSIGASPTPDCGADASEGSGVLALVLVGPGVSLC